ncbi:MAG: undecaprenyl-diphosphate phosphatase [Saprospiraceae bacterium]
MTTLQSIILAIVEGLTEFIPVSSTGHMVLVSAIMHIEEDNFTKLFEIAIQFGAIMAVVVLFWKKFFDFSKLQFYLKLMAAVIPALIFGKLFDDMIDKNLGNPVFIATIIILGGVLLLVTDKMFAKSTIKEEANISIPKAMIIGAFQCLAILFPGLSRSAATIIGGMQQGLSRKLAAEFSFFLAVPTMAAATGYKLMKYINENGMLSGDEIQTLAFGNLIAFIVAMLAIRFFINYLSRHGFAIFGYYRIAVGLLFLGYFWMNH